MKAKYKVLASIIFALVAGSIPIELFLVLSKDSYSSIVLFLIDHSESIITGLICYFIGSVSSIMVLALCKVAGDTDRDIENSNIYSQSLK